MLRFTVMYMKCCHEWFTAFNLDTPIKNSWFIHAHRHARTSLRPRTHSRSHLQRYSVNPSNPDILSHTQWENCLDPVIIDRLLLLFGFVSGWCQHGRYFAFHFVCGCASLTTKHINTPTPLRNPYTQSGVTEEWLYQKVMIANDNILMYFYIF